MGNGHKIKSIVPGSIAEELSLSPGDKLLRINGKKIADIFDYHYLVNDEYLNLLVQKSSGEEWELEIEKDYGEDLGLVFEEGLMDQYRSCRNKCIFCFIDQMPPGMRETLYFKDDDARLSFLQGNYVTLTNMSDEDVKRICFYKLSPINISVHTMNPALRCKMLNNRFAGDALSKIGDFFDAGITMNAQIVLCKGINDGAELDFTIGELEKFLPYMESVSVVPVGKTKYREGLFPLESFDREDARAVLRQIFSWQEKMLSRHKTRFVHASDEWFLTAGWPIPEAEYYEGYGQIENGVGMARSLMDEVLEALSSGKFSPPKKREISLATGVLAVPILTGLLEQIREKFPEITVHLYPIINHFFGEEITVAGLVTGQDLVAQLKGKPLGEYLLIPSVMIRPKECDFLDDYTIKEVESTLQTRVRIVQSDGMSFVRAIVEPFSQGADSQKTS